MSKKRKSEGPHSTRQLIGIEDIKDYCIATRMGDLVFFIIRPTNISVLPDSGVTARIYAAGLAESGRLRPRGHP